MSMLTKQSMRLLNTRKVYVYKQKLYVLAYWGTLRYNYVHTPIAKLYLLDNSFKFRWLCANMGSISFSVHVN
jgi:hypothetical protein